MKKLLATATFLAAASALSAQTLVTADITTDTVWNGEFVLDGPIFVKDDATLTILPGTIVRGQPRRGAGAAVGTAPGSLIVTQSGRIEALGTAAAPIIFTTAAIDNDSNDIPDGAGSFLTGWSAPTDTFYDADPVGSPLGLTAAGAIPGNTLVPVDGATLDNDNTELWGGLIILGEAPVNLADVPGAGAGQGFIEGLPAGADTLYGGQCANDDSGILTFVSVRHGGDEIGTANEINGITLGGVGYGTCMEFCEVYMNYDDGFEWFGGTVNGNNLIASYVGDDSFDGDQGWTGQVQFAFAVQAFTGVGVSGGDEACEFDGDDLDISVVPNEGLNLDLDGNITPLPCYAFANLTTVGPTDATGYEGSAIDANGRITLRNGFVGQLYNVYVQNPTGSFLSWDTGSTPATLGLIDTITVNGGTDGTSAPVFAGLTIANYVGNGFGGSAGLLSADQGVIGGLNPRPSTIGFPPPAGISSTIGLPCPFETVSFVGAFSTNTNLDLWTTGWTALNASGVLVD